MTNKTTAPAPSAGTKPLIASRHPGVIAWLAARGVVGDVVAHATADDVRGRTVVGILPLNLAALAREVVAIDLPRLPPEWRGRELTEEEMDEAGACLVRYRVERVRKGGKPAWRLGGPPRADTADALRDARRRLGWTQAHAAAALAASLRTYQGWEAGRPCRVWPTLALALAYMIAALLSENEAADWWSGASPSIEAA